MKQICITGGMGFLGKYLQERLSKNYKGYKFIILDVIKKELKFKGNFEYSYCDITDIKQVETKIKDCSIVFHLAGIISYKKKDIELMRKVNVKGTENICKICSKYNIKLVYASSTSAVGISENEISDETIYPSKVKGTINCYSRTILEAEMILQKYVKKTYIIIVNLAAILGDNIYFEKTIKTHRKKFVLLFNTYNTFIDVRDAANALIFLEKNGKSGERYIVSTYICTNEEYQRTAIRKLKTKPLTVRLNKKNIQMIKKLVSFFERIFGENLLPVTSEFLLTSDIDKKFSNEKILKLGWKPKHILKDTIEYFVDKYESEK